MTGRPRQPCRRCGAPLPFAMRDCPFCGVPEPLLPRAQSAADWFFLCMYLAIIVGLLALAALVG